VKLFGKFTKTSIISLILVFCLTLTVFAETTGVVTGSAVNMRKDAGTKYDVVVTLAEGTQVNVLGEKGDWYKVSFEDFSGYMSKDYVAVDLKGVVTGSVVNVRKGASTDTKVITSLKKGTVVDILDGTDGWYKIKYKDIVGYMSQKYIDTESVLVAVDADDDNNTTSPTVAPTPRAEENKELGDGYVTASVLNFRSEKSTSSKSNIIAKIPRDTKVYVFYEEDGWYYIEYKDKKGWVSAEYIKLSENSGSSSDDNSSTPDTSENNSSTENNNVSTVSSKQLEVVEYAKKFLGIKYTWGGQSPSEGFDCAGLVKYVYKHFDISLPGGATSQSKHGKVISKSELEPGDLVFFKSPSFNTPIGHVGIYVGDGNFIHAPSKGEVVRIETMNSNYYTKYYVTARRLLSE